MLTTPYQVGKYGLMFSIVFTAIYLVAINESFAADLMFLFGPIGLLGLLGSLCLAGFLIFRAQTPARLLRAAGFWMVIASVWLLESTANWALFQALLIIGFALFAISFFISKE